MAFFVYENWTHERGRGHEATRSYCNSGRGTQAEHSGKNDTWHEFDTREDAEQKLTNLRAKGWENVRWCARCG